MPRVKTDLLQAGMVVGTDVRNMDNMLLIPAGAALTERQITLLKAWGVGEINVHLSSGVVENLDPVARLSPETAARLAAEVRGVFWQADDSNPVFAEVFKLMLRRRARSTTDK